MAANSLAADPAAADHHPPREGLPALALGAIGVVFGDIGTSPLYALKESFVGPHPLAVDAAHIYGVLSMIFWSLTLIVTIKYVFIILRADNRGEGGSMALLALLARKLPGSRRAQGMVLLGVLATALFYGDAIITPAISVLSAVEGLIVVEAGLEPLVLPIAVGILLALFFIQSHGTAKVGVVFGPVILVYFATLAVLGIVNIGAHPEILGIVNPAWAVNFFALDPGLAFLAMGSVVLAVTGAEALYADMGHFGRRPIAFAWLWVAFPCLMLNYMGQGALLLDNPAAAANPFYLMAPEWARLPLVGIATMATIIASQAVISGAFSVTQQAVQLGFLPRFNIRHTSEKAHGQIYIPAVNWAMLVLVVALVLTFEQSTNLASAYGIAVTGTMFISTCMLGVLLFSVWRWNRWLAGAAMALFLVVDGAYFASNLAKIPDGGWFPLVVGAVAFTLLTTWATGRRLMRERMEEGAMPIEIFVGSASSIPRVSGTAVFLASSAEGVPSALLHNIKHNKVLHERVLILTVMVEQVPHIPEEERIDLVELGPGLFRLKLRYGFMEDVDIPEALGRLDRCGAAFRMMDTSFFLGRQKLIASSRPGMALWREKLFAWMMRNSESAMQFFKLPTNRVVELGSQLEI
ncbi:MAG TPA: potassium transporter Kup [Allosphingosinicella sp.]|jgi:KUP system potassium uptake protein